MVGGDGYGGPDVGNTEPDPELAAYFNNAGTFTVVDEEGPFLVTFSDGMASYMEDGVMEQDMVSFESGNFSVIKVVDEEPLRLLPLYEQFAAGLLIEDGEVTLDVLIKGDITDDSFTFPTVGADDLSGQTYYLWDNTRDHDDEYYEGEDDMDDGTEDSDGSEGSKRHSANILRASADIPEEDESDEMPEDETYDEGYEDEHTDGMYDEASFSRFTV